MPTIPLYSGNHCNQIPKQNIGNNKIKARETWHGTKFISAKFLLFHQDTSKCLHCPTWSIYL